MPARGPAVRSFIDIAPGIDPQYPDLFALHNVDDPKPPHSEAEGILDDPPFQLSDVPPAG